MTYDPSDRPAPPSAGATILGTALNIKNLTAGILVALSLLGGAYGSFKPEADAREGYDVLAPDVDLAMDQADANSVALYNLEKRIIKLEAEKQIMEGLLIGYLTAEGKYAIPEKSESTFVGPPEPLPNPVIDMPEQQQLAPINRRKRGEPSWKKK